MSFFFIFRLFRLKQDSHLSPLRCRFFNVYTIRKTTIFEREISERQTNLETRFSRAVCSKQLPQLFGCRVF